MAVAQRGPLFELTFTRPLNATDGERLTKLLQIEIFRAITKQGEKLPVTIPAVAPWLTLSTEDLNRHTVSGRIVFAIRLTGSEFSQSKNATFNFAVRGRTHGYRNHPLEGELSNLVRARFLDVSGPVEDLKVKTTENSLELSWTAPIRSLTSQALSPLSGYHVYKSPTGKPASFQLGGETAVPAFSDSQFAFDQTYFYKVRAVFKQGGQVAESEDSAVQEIVPHDTFPPAAPINMNGLFSAGAVQLVWTANTEPDLAGYNVYRRENNSPPEKLNKDLLRTPTFEDRSAQPGHQYVYYVTAVDLARNESSSSEEFQVETH